MVLPDQNITRQQQVAFSERFGELELSALGRCSTLPNHDCVATTNRHSSGPAKMCVDVIAGPNGRILPERYLGKFPVTRDDKFEDDALDELLREKIVYEPASTYDYAAAEHASAAGRRRASPRRRTAAVIR